jgi:hypothetical protein
MKKTEDQQLLDFVLAPGWIGLFPRVSGRTFRFLVHESVDADAWRGIELASQDAGNAADILGASIEIDRGNSAIAGLAGIVTGSDLGTSQPRVPVVTVTDAPRPECSSMFTIAPSADTRRAALAVWRTSHPEATGDLVLEEWHEALTAHGAAKLNERFVRAHRRSMSSAAWRGYFAVKALTETALRRATASDRARVLLDAELDGHKGVRLVFDRATRTLRQPLYVVRPGVEGSQLVGEVR